METVGDNNLLGVMFILFFLMQIGWILRPTVYNFMIEEQNTQFSKHHVSRCFTITEAYNPSFLIPEPDVFEFEYICTIIF